MIDEEKIMYQNGAFWVLKTRNSYEVRQDVGMYSITDSAYPKYNDGLSIAKARCNYLANKGTKG